MFFSNPGEFEPCGMFNVKHAILLIITIICIGFALKYTKVKEKEDLKKIIKNATIFVWILEILKIIFTISIGRGREINKIVPLYYCSLLLYSGILSAFCKGKLQRIGDVFLSTGGIVAGIVFIIFPTTSLPDYPMLHFISLHSFLFHGTMIYLGLLLNKYRYIELKFLDVFYYAFLVFVVCIAALVVNNKYGSNLMFISQDFPGTILSNAYHDTGKLFTPLCCLVQMTVPFLMIYILIKTKDLINKLIKKEKIEADN